MAKHEGEEFEGAPVARDVAFRFGYGAEEPAEVKPVGPDGNVDLVAREEGDGGTDAVDGGTVGEIAFEVVAKDRGSLFTVRLTLFDVPPISDQGKSPWISLPPR